MPQTYSDVLLVGGVPNQWIKLVSNGIAQTLGTAYVSDAVTTFPSSTQGGGVFSFATGPPADIYTVWTLSGSLSSTQPASGDTRWAATGNASYVVAYTAGDSASLKAGTFKASGPYTPSTVAGTINNVIYVDATFDGVTDDWQAFTDAIAKAAAAGGGDVWATGKGPGKMTALTTKAILITTSNIRLHFATGVFLKFVPTGAVVGGVNDRAVYINGSPGESTARPITGALAIGATNFTATNAGDVSDLVAGDWVVIEQPDTNAGDLALIDWQQVLSVASPVVNLQSPLRTAFPATGGGRTLQFRRITGLIDGVVLDGLTVLQPAYTQAMTCLSVRTARNTRLLNCTATNGWGNAFSSYKCNNVTLIGCTGEADNIQSTEFGATVGLVISACTFENVGSATNAQQQPNATGMNVDFGTCFFAITGNRIGPTGNIGVFFQAVHDGVFSDNEIDWVRNYTIGVGQGISGQGCQRLVVAHNALVGGDGPGNRGMQFSDLSTFSVGIPTQDNLIGPNRINNFTTRYQSPSALDYYIDTPAAGQYAFLNGLSVTSGVVVTSGGANVNGGINVDRSGDALTGGRINIPTAGGIQVAGTDRLIINAAANLIHYSFIPASVSGVTAETRVLQFNTQTLTLTGSYAQQRGFVLSHQIANGAFTLTDATTLYIDGAPTGTATFTRKYQAWFAGADKLRFDTTTQATIGANGAASALTANPVGYLPVYVGTAIQIIPYYNP